MMWNAPFAVAQESFQAPPNSRTIAPFVANLSALGRRGVIGINQQSNLSKYQTEINANREGWQPISAVSSTT
jgi:hypothetical protein